MPLAFALGILLAAFVSHINIGVRHVLPMYAGFAPTDPELDDLWRYATKNNLPVVLHTGTTFVNKAPLRCTLPRLLDEVPLRASRTRDLAAGLDSEDAREAEDPEIEYAKTQVRHAIARYNGLLDRIDAARLQEDSAQAAFKYRYSVIKPPQLPRGPIKPKPAMILVAGLVAGFVLGVIAVALRDLTSRKVLEDWQVEHVIGVPLLGEIRNL